MCPAAAGTVTPVERMQRLGDYLLLNRLNHGGMADVYLAKGFRGTANPVVAVKAIRAAVEDDPTALEMFVGEAKLSVLLTHDNIARTYELGSTDTVHYIVMEYVQGRDLRAVMQRVSDRGLRLPLHLALSLVAQVLEGLDYAHRKCDFSGAPLDIVHCDISPHNIMLSYDGEVKLIDFGIAKAAQHMQPSAANELQGKYGYMSPEQVRGGHSGPRSDLFSLGVVLYELVTQQRLFVGSTELSILEKVRFAEIYPPSMLRPDLAVDIEDIIVRALSRFPDDRFATAAEMQDAVTAALLAQYGPPNQRELAGLLGDLFAEEYAADQQELERAAHIRAMPDGLVEMGPAPEITVISANPLVAERIDSDVSSSPRAEATQITRVRNHLPSTTEVTEDTAKTQLHEVMDATDPSVVLSQYLRWPKKEARIVLLAAAAALLIVMTSWVATRQAVELGGLSIVTVPSGATVILDGRPIGRTPYSADDIAVGPYRAEISLEGYTTVVRPIRVYAVDEATRVHVLLRRSRR